jgi:hypothetical protein
MTFISKAGQCPISEEKPGKPEEEPMPWGS